MLIDSPDEIVQECSYFPRLHRIYAARPCINPPALTTGVGPQGCRIVYHQPVDDSNIDPVLRNLTPGANTVRLFGDNLTNTTPSRVPSPSPPPGSQALSPPPATPVALSRSSGVLATGSRRGPKPSLLSENMMQAARDSIKLVPKKRSFEEGILELQK